MQTVVQERLSRSALRYWGVEHGIPLLIYAVLSVALTWPTVWGFTTGIVSDGGDARHNLWVMWHVKEAMLGRQPLFSAPLLYYPLGISTLVHAVGPVVGLFALPFWPLGPEAAYNGAMLAGFWLTGYIMYRLARGLGFERGVALFAGTLLMSSEMVLAGLRGHIEKTVIFPLPLALLAAHHSLDIRRSNRWAVATALVLLMALLHSGWQFVLAVFAVSFFSLFAWFTDEQHRRELLRRGAIFAVSALVLVGPLLLATLVAAQNPAIVVAKTLESFNNQPDLIEFLLPARSSRLLGQRTTQLLLTQNIYPSIETTVALARTGIAFCLLALASGNKLARRWLLFVLLCVIFALGPTLKVLGWHSFTRYNLTIVLPYAFLTALPGLDFMRKPGQFMLLGFVGISVAACFGLAALTQAAPRWHHSVVALAIFLVLLESWPHPWPQERLRPIPHFYEQIAQDDEMYGVFDLPIKPDPSSWEVSYSSHYQVYQLIHGKGIAAGYLSRTYAPHPLLPCLFALEPVQPDVLVDGEPVNCYTSAQFQLVRHGYRYVVWHKPQPEYPEYRPGSWGEAQIGAWVAMTFGDQPPIVDDDLVRVYALPPSGRDLPVDPVLTLRSGWHRREAGWRWASSPATLEIISPRAQRAMLEITPHLFHDPTRTDGTGVSGDLIVQTDTEEVKVSAVAGETIAMPIVLQSGNQSVTLRLSDGNFRPADYGQPDSRLLSFAVRALELQTRHEGQVDTGAFQPPSGD